MTSAAFALVLGSALCHASWNFLLKRSGHKIAFLWSFGAIAFALFLFPALIYAARDGLGSEWLVFGAGTAFLHGMYGLALTRGYQMGDLSSVYPIARGMGPALVPLLAVIILDESVSVVAGFAIALVVCGIYILNVESFSPNDLMQPLRSLNRPAGRVAVLTGTLIAAYTLWDKAALDHLPAVALNQFAMGGHVLVLFPFVLLDRVRPLAAEWEERRWSILLAGVLAPLAYVLVLAALTSGRVSYIAPAREVGIVIGALLGVVFLGEGYGRWRISGSLLIVAGALTLGLAP
ncbi:MAG: DMT family transporter [Dehalococcoidia bacterium]